MASFPDAIASFRTVADRIGVVYNALLTKVFFAKDYNDVANEVVAIETILGLNPEGYFTSVVDRLDDVDYYVDALLSDWLPLSATIEFDSVDDPTGVITANADLTGVLSAGKRITFDNDGNTIYGIISKTPTYASSVTTITFLHEINPADSEALHLMADSAITNFQVSSVKAPFGFPLDPLKWRVELFNITETEQTTPTSGTWYNLGTISLSIPIGSWNVEYFSGLMVRDSSGVISGQTTLSTANNSESDADFTDEFMFQETGPTGLRNRIPMHRSKPVNLSSKTTHYLNHRTLSSGIDAIRVNETAGGITAKTIIRAVCAYL